jgi:MFS family permease
MDRMTRDSRKHFPPTETSPLVKVVSSSEESNGDGINDEATMNWTLFTTIFVVTVGSSLQFGYGTGVMNNSEFFILEYFHDRGLEYDIFHWGTTVSCYGIGGLVGAVLGPKVIGRYVGRRSTLLINNIFLVMSSILIAFAPAWWYQAIGRIFVGIVAGVSTAVVPTYFAEISPIATRGAIGTTHQLGITVGILLSQALSTPSLHMLGSKDKWQWLFLVPVLCGLLEVIVLPFCPESPSYLYTTQGKEAARAALVRLQSEAVADRYNEYIREEIESGSGGNGEMMTVWELLCDRSLRKQLVVGITVQLMMQFSGIDAVFYYSTTVFKQAEVPDPELATTCLGIINVIVVSASHSFGGLKTDAARTFLIACFYSNRLFLLSSTWIVLAVKLC